MRLFLVKILWTISASTDFIKLGIAKKLPTTSAILMACREPGRSIAMWRACIHRLVRIQAGQLAAFFWWKFTKQNREESLPNISKVWYLKVRWSLVHPFGWVWTAEQHPTWLQNKLWWLSCGQFHLFLAWICHYDAAKIDSTTKNAPSDMQPSRRWKPPSNALSLNPSIQPM